MKVFGSLLIAAMLALPTVSVAAVVNDEVTSAKIKEADGTTAQDTNAGSGVKTGHLQNGAVTAAKIATGTITATQLAAGSVGAAQLASGAVTNSKLADGAVSDSKIAGPISASKIVGLVGLANYANIKVVHKGAADGVYTFSTITAALAAIGDASAQNPYEILVMPGIYAEIFDTKAFVTIRGSGRDLTKVTSSVTSMIGTRATVHVLTEASPLRDLTIENTSAAQSVAVYVANGAQLEMTGCRISTPAAATTFGVYLNQAGTFVIRDSQIEASAQDAAYAVLVSSPVATGVSVIDRTSISSQGGTESQAVQVAYGSCPLEILDSRLIASGAATSYTKMALYYESSPSVFTKGSIFAVQGAPGFSLGLGLAGVLNAANSQLIGPIYHPSQVKLFGCYDDALNGL